MAKTAVKSPGARRGRPPLKLGSPKRSSFNTRLRTEVKQQLETEAHIAGRSLSEEIEFRLERSLQQEADSGGRELHGLIRLLVGVAEIIQARNGKSASDDWKTGIAVGRAWKSLIHDWLAKPPAQWVAEASWLKDAIKPERPEQPSQGTGLLAARSPEEEFVAYPGKLQEYYKEMEAFENEYSAHMIVYRKMQDEFNQALGIGDEALGLLSDHEK